LPDAKRVNETTTRFRDKRPNNDLRSMTSAHVSPSIAASPVLSASISSTNRLYFDWSNMEQFYSENVDKYHSLLAKLDSTPKPRLSAGIHGPNMVVGARIRPLLKGDGFPAAVFPRSSQQNVADIHDLYNHPSGIPILKVSAINSSDSGNWLTLSVLVL
jgi:hypothetical protein